MFFVCPYDPKLNLEIVLGKDITQNDVLVNI